MKKLDQLRKDNNMNMSYNFGRIVLLIVSTIGVTISVDNVIDEGGLIPTLIYTFSFLGMLGASYILIKEENK
jgi:hypothetical protein